MKKHYLIFIFLLVLISHDLLAQCTIQVSGYIVDKGSNEPLEFATLYVKEINDGETTDETGFFDLPLLCEGGYHLEVSHIGCQSKEIFLKVKGDTILNIFMEHHSELLDEVLVHGEKGNISAQKSTSITREAITESTHKNLGDLLGELTGVQTIKNGSGIVKPVIHGLYGNRVAIMNNEVIQAGQQWGNDHAPEIDPYMADHISVIKGVAGLAYGGNNLGGVVLVEPRSLPTDPHLHGEVQYNYQTNGRGHTINTSLGRQAKFASWRVAGTYKRYGDQHAPDYYLNNTGKSESNLSLQMKKDFTQRLNTELYYSFFSTNIGILRGSHIGNLSDLESAIDRDEPFFTEDDFSYGLEAPRQSVQHHLAKLESNYFIADDQIIKLRYSFQLNEREEYDVRRSGRSDIPSLSLQQYANQFDVIYQQEFQGEQLIKSGLQVRYLVNENDPETGILPLIPDYTLFNPSTYFIYNIRKGRLFAEAGIRYDLRKLDVTTISRTLPREIVYYDHTYHNFSLATGVNYELKDQWTIGINTGIAVRAPEVNELYSYGLHQGVSGIEEGDPSLENEQSWKTTLSMDVGLNGRFYMQSLSYLQFIENYIFLEPQDEFILTIRGAFPLFLYKQTSGLIYGQDFLAKYAGENNWNATLRYSLVRGRDRNANRGLVFIPSDNLALSIEKLFGSWSIFKDSGIELNNQYVWRQKRIEADQDFLNPPDGYFLTDLAIKTQIDVGQEVFELGIEIDNLFDVTYRDYLDRLRYYSDAPGRNFVLRLRMSF